MKQELKHQKPLISLIEGMKADPMFEDWVGECSAIYFFQSENNPSDNIEEINLILKNKSLFFKEQARIIIASRTCLKKLDLISKNCPMITELYSGNVLFTKLKEYYWTEIFQNEFKDGNALIFLDSKKSVKFALKYSILDLKLIDLIASFTENCHLQLKKQLCFYGTGNSDNSFSQKQAFNSVE